MQEDGHIRYKQAKGDAVLTFQEALTAGSTTAKLLQLGLMTTDLNTVERASLALYDPRLRVQSYQAAFEELTQEQHEDMLRKHKLESKQLTTGEDMSVANQ